ncbi:MAG: biopolymer transporter ExbD [Verrucomicrobiales bacterium]|nr:biopolymer transporter ExbD [Verrucomicrobiales bacterium]
MRFGSPVPKKHSRIEIIPLIDVMFFLLASFMMVSLNMSKLNAVKVDAPLAVTGDKDIKADVFNIALNKQGEIFLGESNTTLMNLGITLSNRFHGAGTNVPVFVTGDRDTSHGAVLAVLDLVRRAGIQRVSFSVTPQEAP